MKVIYAIAVVADLVLAALLVGGVAIVLPVTDQKA